MVDPHFKNIPKITGDIFQIRVVYSDLPFGHSHRWQVSASQMKMSDYYYPACPTGTFHQCPESWDSGEGATNAHERAWVNTGIMRTANYVTSND